MSNTAKTSNNTDASNSGVNNTAPNDTSTNSTSNDTGAVTQAKKSKLDTTKKRTFTILLIGETGAGKTSFMSLLVNLFQGMGPFELRDKHDKGKESGLDRQYSQTTKASLYTVTSTDGTQIRILDTPGLADTRGIEQDKKHKKEINDAIKEFVTAIDAVIIMANGTVEKLGAATDYTLSVLAAMFPGSIIDNIGFIFTNSSILTFNFRIDALRPELRQAKYWLLQNPLALYKNYENQVKNNTPEEILETHRDMLEANYHETVRTLNKFMKWLDERTLQPVKEINDLYQMSLGIESRIDAALSAITHSADRRQKMNDIKFKLGNAEQRKSALEELKKQQEAPVWDRQESDKVNTICIAPNCYKNCHSPCSLNFMNDPADLGRQCGAFVGSPVPAGGDAAKRCQDPGCGHEASLHRHYYHIHILKGREMNPETKEQLEQAKTGEQELKAAEDTIQKELKTIKEDINKAQGDIRRLVDDYNKIALSKDFAGHIQSAIAMLKLRKDELKSKPNTQSEVEMIDNSIAAFEQKLELLVNREGSTWNIVDKVVGKVVGGANVVISYIAGDSK
ncbi:hypothetical protein AX16_006338 [Volvariella volvacea WC 439]|nr:hypothetical protein AX16_006338 [Volvariella volvacea WC 439]